MQIIKKEDAKTIKKLIKKIEKLKTIVLDLKSSKIKDSTNSGKPSSTNGLKKVIQNNRVKSGKAKGGQKGRMGKTLKIVDKPDKIINVMEKDVCECGGKIIDNTTEYIKKQVIDILNTLKTIEYRYVKGKCEKCVKEHIAKIPQNHANPVQYSDNVKSLIPVIRNISNMSVETTKNVFTTMYKELNISISISWIHKQDKILAQKCTSVVEKMKNYLTLVDLAHSDETSIKIDDKLGCCLAFSNEKVVVYGMYENKSKASFDEFGIYKAFSGILMHDHNKTYYMYKAMQHAECNVHIQRYLKYVIDVFGRKAAQKLKDYKEEHLRPVKDFKVPFSNNETERNLIKIKINVSRRFGKLECAKDYAIIKNIIETAKKQKKDIFRVFLEILKDNDDVFDLNIDNKDNARNWEKAS